MRKVVACAGLASVAFASSAWAGAPCPARETGTYPWDIQGAIDGDYYAWVYLVIGKNRRPEKCLMGDNNIHDDQMRFFACKAFVDGWDPASANDVQPGQQIKRFFVIPGDKHSKANKEARRKFFVDHPNERPECYPED